MSRDPLGFEAGDANFYRYVRNDPINYVDPSGLWRIQRRNGHVARAISENGNSIDTLARRIGLDEKEWKLWLTGWTAEKTQVLLQNGLTKFVSELKTNDKLDGGCGFFIPNSISMIWTGDLRAFGRWTRSWSQDRDYLQDRGFHVNEYIFGRKSSPTTEAVLDNIGEEARAGELHGLFIMGHGSPSGFGGKKGFLYSEVMGQLTYGLGLVIINACNGGWSRFDKDVGGVRGATIDAGGRDLVVLARNNARNSRAAATLGREAHLPPGGSHARSKTSPVDLGPG